MRSSSVPVLPYLSYLSCSLEAKECVTIQATNQEKPSGYGSTASRVLGTNLALLSARVIFTTYPNGPRNSDYAPAISLTSPALTHPRAKCLPL